MDAPPPAGRRHTLSVVLLLALHVVLATWAAAGKSVTADEILHLTGGYFYNAHGDYRIQPENGNLPQRVAALPACVLGVPEPVLARNVYWQTADPQMVGYQLFYETGHDHFPMLMAGRALIALFSAGTGWLVYWWARRLFGGTAAIVALALYALDPSMLAHAALTTSDAAAVFCLLAAVTAFWLHLREPGAAGTAGSALVFGLACVAKYSAVLLLPVFALLLVWRVARESPGRRARWWGLAAGSAATHAAGAAFVIWLFYGFRYSAFAPGLDQSASFSVPWEPILGAIGVQGRLVGLARSLHLLPEAYLYGYAWVLWSAQARGAFLAGELGTHGWVSFFPLAFAWKTTLPLLAVLPAGAVVLARRWRGAAARPADDLAAIAPLLVFTAIYWAFALTSHLNIGHRHILPVYFVLFVLAGGLVTAAGLPTRARWAAGAALVLGQAATCAMAYPHFLAYFNPLAGGPAHGYRLLVDSSLDWGQDLPGLKAWLDRHNAGPTRARVHLAYFGSGEPDYYHIDAVRLPFVNGFPKRLAWYEIKGGLFCISATLLQQTYSPVRGPWSLESEREYQELRKFAPIFRRFWTDRAARADILKSTTSERMERAWSRFDLLRFARLCAYLRTREPDAMIGYSILVYRVDEATITQVLDRSYSEWLHATGAGQ